MADELDLEKLGLVNQGLFLVQGEIAERYNRVLRTVFDLDCKEDNFRIDKRGLSPELCAYFKSKYPDRLEFGENYLNMRSANQFMVIVSPDQRDAPLVAPQASYENKVYDLVSKTARHTIEQITESEALFGELENHISIFRNAEDLLQLRGIEVSLDTLDKTVNASARLRGLSAGLDKGNNALDPEYINQMLELVRQKAKTDSLSDIFPIKSEVHCFYAEFFKGVHCLRNFKNTEDIKTMFVYHHQKRKDLGEDVLSIDLHDELLIDSLHKYGFVGYDPSLAEQRITEIEDEVLLGEGVDVSRIAPYERKRLLVKHEGLLPKSWSELSEIQYVARNSRKKSIAEAISDKSAETKIKLARAVNKEEIVNHMLAELDPTDQMRVYEFNRKKFITEYPGLPINRKKYAIDFILNRMKGGKDKDVHTLV